MISKSDIDIDVPFRDKALDALPEYINASIINNNIIKPHNVGVYLQDAPTFLNTNMSSIPYEKMHEFGFFKLDILTNTVYEDVKDENHLDRLLNTEPNWNLLLDERIVQNLFQIHRYYELLKKWKPSSVVELAMFISMIRPSKKHLFEFNSWEAIKNEIWEPPVDDSPYFKKSHSIAYAMVIVVQLNLFDGVE